MKKTKREGGNYKHFNQHERDRIQALLDEKVKLSEIARILKRDKGSVSREIKRNRRKKRVRGGTKNGSYEAGVAEQKAYVRRKYAKYQGKKINENKNLELYIIWGLINHWSPDEISGRMKRERRPFYASKTAIYEWLYSIYGCRWHTCLYAKRYHPKKRKGQKTKKALIPNRISISLRPLGATNKTRYGHYESDTMVSAKKTGSKEALSVVYERKAKYIDAKKIENLKPSSNNLAIVAMQNELVMKSLSRDNGIENTKHEELGIPSYFCDPYSSWQKGGVENANKMIRKFIPKKSDLADYSNEYVKMVIDILNNKPRKSLNYKTAHEVMVEHNLLKDNKKTEVALRG